MIMVEITTNCSFSAIIKLMDIKKLISIINKEIRFDASKSSGPGGQNVNKRNTKVSGLWNFSVSRGISEDDKKVIIEKLGRKILGGRSIIIDSGDSRSQLQNKKEVVFKMAKLINGAIKKTTPRVPTKISLSAQKKRLEKKTKHSLKKKSRKIL